jgi:apolipoprotein N-acyltransferase
VIGADAVPVANAGRVAGVAKKTRAAWAGKVVFLMIASVLNASFWWGIGILVLGSSWATPLLILGLAIWFLTFCSLALCGSGS